VSTTLGAAIPEERAHQGYIEGIAIWIAIILVTGVGARRRCPPPADRPR
jgi:Ca2+-transporting ATPase